MDFSSTIVPNIVGDNENLMQFQAHYLWALIVGFHLSFTFAFAMGANEVSNAFATSVASGAINLTIAYFLATFVESAGGVLLGYKVLETLRFKVIDLSMYENAPNELLVGQVAILGGSACWMLLSVLAKLPVSSTHSHVGSIIGFSLVMRGTAGLHIENVVKIVISWIASPVISGIISAILYIIFDHAVLRRKNPLMAGFRAMPFFYFAVFTFITFIVIYQGSKWIHFDKTPFWLAVCVSLAIGIFAAIIFQFFVRPFLLKWVQKSDQRAKEELPEAAGQHSSLERIHSAPLESPSSEQLGETSNRTHHRQHRRQTIEYTPKGFLGWLLPNGHRKDAPQTLRLFSAIQVFTACFTGFSHGSKDIPNTIAPLATLLFVFSTAKVPSLMETDLWILFYGSLGTCVGFWIMGHRVIETVGTEFTKIDPPSGFTVELGSAITVVIASKLGIPISLTLCIVGSIVAVGAVRGSVPVNWGLFRNVFLTWLLTFPVSGIFAAFLMFILKFFFL